MYMNFICIDIMQTKKDVSELVSKVQTGALPLKPFLSLVKIIYYIKVQSLFYTNWYFCDENILFWNPFHTHLVILEVLGDPEVTENIYCKSRNLPNTDTQNYSTDWRYLLSHPVHLIFRIICPSLAQFRHNKDRP